MEPEEPGRGTRGRVRTCPSAVSGFGRRLWSIAARRALRYHWPRVNALAKSLGSYWSYSIAIVAAAFVVSPIVVARLGHEAYGVWSTLLSAGGYLTVLDFGVHAALVRHVAKHAARGDERALSATYSTALTLLSAFAITTFLILFGCSTRLVDFFGVPAPLRAEAILVCRIVAVDFALGLFGAAFLGALAGLQRFVHVNLATIGLVIAKSVVLVVLLERGAGLTTVALVQVAATIGKHTLQYVLLRRERPSLRWRWSAWSRSEARELLSYGAYAVVAVLALKLLLYTDALVIARRLSAEHVTDYAVPASILEHVERLALAGIAVLVPWISAKDAVGDLAGQRTLYVAGTRYAALLVLPIVATLFAVGDDFLRIWMGASIAENGASVLRVLVVGQLFALPQLLAHGVLKGTGRIRFLATTLIAQAVANLALSLWWIGDHGLVGVAMGTLVPVIVVNAAILPVALCRLLDLRILRYAVAAYALPLALAVGFVGAELAFPYTAHGYAGIALYAGVAVVVVALAAWRFGLEPDHRDRLIAWVTRRGTRSAR